MRVLFVIGSMSSGGAERVVSEMSNYWVKRNWSVSILTTNKTKNKQDFYILDSRVKRIDITSLGKMHKAKYFFNLFSNLRDKIKEENPNVVISFMSGANTISIISMLGLKTPLIISDRHNPYTDKVGYFYKKLLYPFSDILVLQTNAVIEFYSKIKGLNIEVISNPISLSPIKEKDISKNTLSKTICAIGRLNIALKGFDLLIKAFIKISQKYPDWNLIILGEGKDRKILEKLIEEYSLQNRITLVGNVDNPREIIEGAEIFVLSSLEEGFPNVLLEAMSMGLAPISFDCNFGPREIIEDNKSGILVELGSIDKLSSAMSRLIENKELRNRLGKNAQIRVSKSFYIDKIIQQWETLINRVIKK